MPRAYTCVDATPEDDFGLLIGGSFRRWQRKNPEKNGKNRTFLGAAREQIG
jgi:hypothetical protein